MKSIFIIFSLCALIFDVQAQNESIDELLLKLESLSLPSEVQITQIKMSNLPDDAKLYFLDPRAKNITAQVYFEIISIISRSLTDSEKEAVTKILTNRTYIRPSEISKLDFQKMESLIAVSQTFIGSSFEFLERIFIFCLAVQAAKANEINLDFDSLEIEDKAKLLTQQSRFVKQWQWAFLHALPKTWLLQMRSMMDIQEFKIQFKTKAKPLREIVSNADLPLSHFLLEERLAGRYWYLEDSISKLEAEQNRASLVNAIKLFLSLCVGTLASNLLF